MFKPINGQETITTAGTAEAFPVTGEGYVTITANTANTQDIYVGDSSVDSSNGKVLDAGQQASFYLEDLALLYIDVDVNGEGYDYSGGLIKN